MDDVAFDGAVVRHLDRPHPPSGIARNLAIARRRLVDADVARCRRLPAEGIAILRSTDQDVSRTATFDRLADGPTRHGHLAGLIKALIAFAENDSFGIDSGHVGAEGTFLDHFLIDVSRPYLPYSEVGVA